MKQKLLFSLVFFLCLIMGEKAEAQTLAAGDIAFIGLNNSAPDSFSFIVLKSIPAGETLYFTEQGWNGSSWLSNSEVHMQWTTTASVSCGTIISVVENTTDVFVTTGSADNVTIALGSNFSILGGDQILAYQSSSGIRPTETTPVFIAAIHADYTDNNNDPSTGWNSVALAEADKSVIPSGLTNGINCVSIFPNTEEQNNVKYNGILSGTSDVIRASINNYLNWSTNDFTAYDITPSSYSSPNIDCTSCINPTVTANPPNRAICAGNNTTFTVSATGATAYQWQVNTGSGFTDIANGGVYSGATTGTLTITGATAAMNGYQYRGVAINGSASCFTNSNLGTLSISNIVLGSSQSNILCNGGSNGSAGVSPSGGIGSYTYSWSPSGGSGSIATGLSEGTYTVTVTDAIGCETTRSFTITEPPSALTASASSTDVSCFGGANGTATVTASGGTPSYSYSWSPSGGTNATATGLTAGTYTCTIMDVNGCIKTEEVVVNQPTTPVSGSAVISNVSCNGGANGAIDITPAGGTSPFTYNWDDGPTTQDRINLTAGTYSVEITDNNGCTSTVNATVTQPSVVSASTVVTNIACFGGATGAINLTPTGGTGSYTFDWGGGITTEDRTSLTAGTYSVEITDASGCTGTVTVTITQPTSPVSGTTVVSNVSCNGGANGSINLTPTGGNSPYTFDWGGGITTEDRTGLAEGTYSVTITDATGCTGTVTASVTQPTPIAGTTVVSNISCSGGANGSINLTPTGGIEPYTFDWGGGITTEDRTGLAEGTYSVTITDANGCTGTVTASVTQPTPIAGTTVVSNVSCNGGNNGVINLTPTGGIGPYTFDWGGGITTKDRAGLAEGTYSVTITDANGCTGTVTASVTQPTPIAGTTVISNVSCNGGNNGAINLTPTGGTPPYTFEWSDGATTEDRTNLTAGNYSVEITDSNSCTGTINVIVTQPSALVASAGPQTNVSCNGGSNGSATATPSGGTAPYSYSWSPSGGTNATATGLAAGTYTVTVTDDNGCTAIETVTIDEPAASVSGTTIVIPVSCNGGSNGAINLTPVGGTSPYTFDWGGGITTEDRTGLTAGTYAVEITDGNGCTATVNATVTQPAALIATATAQTNVACFGGATGSATVTASGGIGTYSYSWAPSGGTEATASGLAAGTYTVTVTDENGCTAIQTFTLTEPTLPVSGTTVITSVSCNGGSDGSINLTPSGGSGTYTFEWNDGITIEDRTGLTAGSYSVDITDNNGCTETVNAVVTQPTAVVASAGSQTNISCNGGSNGSATVTASGGTGSYSYSWSPSGGTSATATGLTAGTYIVTVEDTYGCTATQTFILTEPDSLSATIIKTDVSCNGDSDGTATVTAGGGTAPYSYIWSHSGSTEATATGLAVGTYTVTVTDNNNCQTTATVTIDEPSVLIASAVKTNVSCNAGTDGEATAAATGGTAPYTFLWSNGEETSTITNLTADTYTVTITDVNGCTDTVSVSINTTPDIIDPIADITELNNVVVQCEVEAGVITAPTATDNCAGVLTATTTDPLTYIEQGTYTITWTYDDGNGNTATQTQNVIVEDTTDPAADIIELDDVVVQCEVEAGVITAPTATDNCAGVLTATSTDPLTYTEQGTYTITWTYDDGNGNTATQTQNVIVEDTTDPVADIIELDDVVVQCEVEAGVITAPTATDNYAGELTATTTDPLTYTEQGTYTIAWTYDDGNGNTATQTQNVIVDDTTNPVADVTALTDIVVECEVETGVITAPTATDNCVGVLTATTTDPLTYTEQGTYTITWTYDDGNGNTATQTQNVIVEDTTDPAADIIELDDVVVQCEVEAGVITAPTATDNCAGVLTATTTDPLTYTEQGTYTITWTYDDGNGNTATQTQNVIVEDTTDPVANIVELDDIVAECEVEAAMITAPTATDNCAGALTGTTTDPLTYTEQGTYTITWIYDDGNGNTVTQTQNVIVEDTTDPVADITNLPDIINYCGVMTDEIDVPTATDNCSGTLTASTSDPLEYTTEGTYTITWTYDDGNGNTTTQTQNVIVDASPLDQVTFDEAVFVYNGNVQSIEVNNLPAGATVTYTTSPETGNENGAVNAGEYTVTATILPQAEAFNCEPVVLTAVLTIERAPQSIIFDAIPVKNLETDPDFQLDAIASSGLEVYYTYDFTSPDPAATVTPEGFVDMLTSGEIIITAHQDGNDNYLSAEDVSQVLIIESGDASVLTLTIGDEVFENPSDQVYYLMDCGDTADSVEITMVTESGATVEPGLTFSINTPEPGIYSQIVTVTSQDGTVTQEYTITVERRFNFSDIVVQKFDNVLLVNNNPQNNGGYQFTAYQWFKNGVPAGTGQYFSEGNDPTDTLDPDAEYMVQVTTAQGEVLQTCIGQILLLHSNQARLYPNPVVTGRTITIEADFPIAELQEMEISIYSLTGSLVTTVKSSTLSNEIQIPVNLEAATYIVVLNTPNIRKSFKLVVDK